jgi:hypothetical protein
MVGDIRNLSEDKLSFLPIIINIKTTLYKDEDYGSYDLYTDGG